MNHLSVHRIPVLFRLETFFCRQILKKRASIRCREPVARWNSPRRVSFRWGVLARLQNAPVVLRINILQRGAKRTAIVRLEERKRSTIVNNIFQLYFWPICWTGNTVSSGVIVKEQSQFLLVLPPKLRRDLESPRTPLVFWIYIHNCLRHCLFVVRLQ